MAQKEYTYTEAAVEQVPLGRFFEYYVKHYFIIEPRFNVVAGYGTARR